MSEFVQGTPNPSDDELRAIAKRGRDAYSLATDNGWSERESNLAAYESLYVAGRVAGLEEAEAYQLKTMNRLIMERDAADGIPTILALMHRALEAENSLNNIRAMIRAKK